MELFPDNFVEFFVLNSFKKLYWRPKETNISCKNDLHFDRINMTLTIGTNKKQQSFRLVFSKFFSEKHPMRPAHLYAVENEKNPRGILALLKMKNPYRVLDRFFNATDFEQWMVKKN